MLMEPTIQKLRALRLSAMADGLIAQIKDPQMASASFEERLGFLVDAQFLARDNRRISRLLNVAKLRYPQASLEDVEASPARGLDKARLRQFATCLWVKECQPILIDGPTGVGKSYVVSALGQAACRMGFNTSYRRVPRLFDELALAHLDGTYARLQSFLAKVDVLILDDFGIGALNDQRRQDLFEIFEDRSGRKATVVASQLPVAKWYDWIADPTVSDGMLDRMMESAHRIELRGGSRRRTAEEPKKNEQNGEAGVGR